MLDLKVDEVNALGVGDEDVEAWANDAVEFAEALNDAGSVGPDGEEGLEDGDESYDGDDEEEDQQADVQRFHNVSVPLQARIQDDSEIDYEVLSRCYAGGR